MLSILSYSGFYGSMNSNIAYFRELVSSGKPLSVSTHSDADGVIAAVLLSTVTRIATSSKEHPNCPEFPSTFGKVGDVDVVLDQLPQAGTVRVNRAPLTVVVDHHPNHPETPPYKLVWDSVPTSLIVYEALKDMIPKEDAWKVAIGLVGDGQPELIPSEIWLEHRELLYEYGWVSESYGQTKFYSYPAYRLLSRAVNDICRANCPEVAFEMAKNCLLYTSDAADE